MREGLRWTLFLVLGVVALAIPPVLFAFFGPVPAVLAGVALAIAWVMVFPSTCSSGGFGASSLATAQLSSGCGWLVLGIALLIGFAWRCWTG